MVKRFMCVLLVSLLCACGGGDEDEQATTDPVDCKARPETCR